MAQLRLIAALAVAACSSSAAAPGTAAGSAVPIPPGVNPPFETPRAQIATPPAGWIAMPSLASAALEALKPARANGDAWGEPAMGCYAVAVTFAARGTAPVVAKALRAQVEAVMPIRDVVEPAAGASDGVLAFAFEKAPYHGRARVAIAGPGVTALACFWNAREPAACEAACTGLVGRMR